MADTPEGNAELFRSAISKFLEMVPRHIQYFGMGGDVAIPAPFELALLQVFQKTPPGSRAELVPTAERLTVHQAYILGAFSVRMATVAVRTNDIDILRGGTFGIVIDEDLVDWRDALSGYAVLDDAASPDYSSLALLAFFAVLE